MAGKCILIVEDEPVSEQVTRSTLTGLGYTVPAAAASGEEAIRLAGEARPDLVLMDIYLQGKMDGIAAADEIRKSFDIPIIFLTAESSEDVTAQARNSSSYGYLIKPVETKELHSAIDTALHHHQMTRELKTAQRALEEQKTFLAQVVDISPNPIFVRDREGHYVLANQAAAASLSVTVAELVGKTEVEFNASSEQAEKLLAEDREVMDSLKEKFIPEEQTLYPDGSNRWIQAVKRPIIGPDGSADQILVTLVDISARKEYQAALLQQHHTLNARVKELKCLYRLSRALENIGFLDEKFFLSILEIIPPAWQFPEITAAKIIYENQEYTTDNFSSTSWMIASNIVVFGESLGTIMVSYLAERPSETFGPFLKEEQTLLNEIVERVGKTIERHRIEAAERQQRALAEAINDTSAALSSTLNLNEVLARISENVGRIVPNDAANIWLLQKQSGVDTVVHGAGDGEVALDIVSGMAVSEIPAYRQMMETGRGMAIADTRKSSKWLSFPESDWVRSFVSTPIYVKEVLVGFLNLDSATPGFYNDTHVRRLRGITHQAAIAIENARLFEESQQYLAESETLRQAGAAVAASMKLDETLDRILEQLNQVIPCDSTSVLLVDGNDVEIVRGRGYPDSYKVIGKRFSLKEETPDALIYTTRKPVNSGDVHADYPGKFTLPNSKKFISWLGVPLIIKGEVTGIVTLHSLQKDFFTPEHTRLASSFANQVAIAIENNRLFQELWDGRRRLQALTRQLLSLQEAEKKHTARELHDEVGQSLTALKLNLQAMQYQVTEAAVHTQLNDSIGIVDRALAQVRGLLLDLRPTLLDDLGLTSALRSHLDRTMQRTGIAIHFESDAFSERLPTEIETICYRVVQEALTNISKHASADQVTVTLRRLESELQFSIQDDGVGFHVAAARERGAQGKSLGLISMEERVLLGGGRIEIESSPSAGTKITAWLPLPPISADSLEG